MTHALERAASAATVLTRRLGDDLRVAVVLGSGWVDVAEGLGTTRAQLPLAELPGVPAPTVEGHSGLARSVDVDGVPQAFADLGNPEAHAKILVVP